MNPSRILPDLQCSLLVEDVRQEINGNMILLGVVNAIRVPQLPVTAPRLMFFNRWTAGFGRFKETMRLIAPDQNTVMGKCEVGFELPDPSVHAMNVAVFGNVTFNTPGVYYAEVLVDEVMKIRYPIHLAVVPPPQPPGTPPTKAVTPPQTA